MGSRVVSEDTTMEKAHMGKHNILDVAEWFLQQQPMTHNKVQKMCYYAVAWSYAIYGKSLFADSVFEAWSRGPVSRTIFNKFASNPYAELTPERRSIVLTARENVLLESVMLTYGDYSATTLEALSETEPPLIRAMAYVRGGEPAHRPIDTKDMKEYYRSIYSGNLE